MARMSPGRPIGFIHALQAFERIQLGDRVFWNEPSSLAMRDFVAQTAACR